MGRSYTVKAGEVLEMVAVVATDGSRSSNTFQNGKDKFFYELGREQFDGSITGTVHKFLQNGMAIKHGSFKIEASGKIARFAGLASKQIKEIEETGLKACARRHPMFQFA